MEGNINTDSQLRMKVISDTFFASFTDRELDTQILDPVSQGSMPTSAAQTSNKTVHKKSLAMYKVVKGLSDLCIY